MSEASISGPDAVAAFAVEIGFTRKLAATAVASQTSDDGGPLPPARYLLQIINPDNVATIVWVRAVPFVKGEVVGVDQDAPSFPLQRNGLQAFAFNVLPGVSDRIAARCSAGGTATLYITRVSRDA